MQTDTFPLPFRVPILISSLVRIAIRIALMLPPPPPPQLLLYLWRISCHYFGSRFCLRVAVRFLVCCVRSQRRRRRRQRRRNWVAVQFLVRFRSVLCAFYLFAPNRKQTRRPLSAFAQLSVGGARGALFVAHFGGDGGDDGGDDTRQAH